MKNSLIPRRLAALAVLWLGCPPFLLAQVSFADLGVRIIPRNAYYSILSVEESENPGFLEFTVNSAHASYRIEGVLSLIKALHEIEVIEKIRRSEEGSGFFAGAGSTVGSTADGFVKLVKNPIESGKGLGRAVGKIGTSIGGVFREKEAGEKTSFKDSLIGRSERELAKEYEVDVYTSNPNLKKLLNGMAKARASGKGVAVVASFLIPVAGIAGIALTASSVNGKADILVNDSSKPELFRVNRQGLLALKIPAADVDRFINSPYYTPREATYIRTYLEQLRYAIGFRDVFKIASEVQSYVDAEKILYALQIAAAEALKDPYVFDHIEIKGDGVWAATEKKVVWILPYDYLQNNRHGSILLDQAVEEWRTYPKRDFEIWSAGQVKQDFLRAASARGIKLQWFRLWGGAKSRGQI